MSEVKTKFPEHIGFVDPLTVSPDSARTQRLRYNDLRPYADSRTKAAEEWDTLYWSDINDDNIDEKAAKEIAVHYLLRTALRLEDADNDSERGLWADRYTIASAELFGAPEPELARSLFFSNTQALLEIARHTNVDSQLIENYEAITGSTESSSQTTAVEKEDTDIAQILLEMQEVLETRHSVAFNALELDTLPESIDSNGIADAFERGLNALSETYDKSWSEWSVVRKEGSDSLAVHVTRREISVGMNRTAVSKGELKALFAHEVLTHSLRAVNGYKLSQQMGDGLPGFVDIEEGMGVFNEYAVTGMQPAKVVDRYTDIAYAMGQIDGHTHTRQELLELALTRAHLRNESLSQDKKLSDEVIEAGVYKNINRIYRGGPGDEHVAVFTKDHVYYSGYLDYCQYLKEQRASGKTMDEIYDYIMQARFNPLIKSHVEAVELAKRYNG